MTTSTIQRWRGSAALPGLLLTLTTITGLVDAVSYLKLGNVFVANMTGNTLLVRAEVWVAPIRTAER
jgi:uncharacterized membrane protein YoaK (UPF0700 family)